MKYFKKFFYLFDDLNKKITFLVVITFLSSLFEILGLGLIAPIVSGILDPEKLNSFEEFIHEDVPGDWMGGKSDLIKKGPGGILELIWQTGWSENFNKTL